MEEVLKVKYLLTYNTYIPPLFMQYKDYTEYLSLSIHI